VNCTATSLFGGRRKPCIQM